MTSYNTVTGRGYILSALVVWALATLPFSALALDFTKACTGQSVQGFDDRTLPKELPTDPKSFPIVTFNANFCGLTTPICTRNGVDTYKCGASSPANKAASGPEIKTSTLGYTSAELARRYFHFAHQGLDLNIPDTDIVTGLCNAAPSGTKLVKPDNANNLKTIKPGDLVIFTDKSLGGPKCNSLASGVSVFQDIDTRGQAGIVHAINGSMVDFFTQNSGKALGTTNAKDFKDAKDVRMTLAATCSCGFLNVEAKPAATAASGGSGAQNGKGGQGGSGSGDPANSTDPTDPSATPAPDAPTCLGTCLPLSSVKSCVQLSNGTDAGPGGCSPGNFCCIPKEETTCQDLDTCTVTTVHVGAACPGKAVVVSAASTTNCVPKTPVDICYTQENVEFGVIAQSCTIVPCSTCADNKTCKHGAPTRTDCAIIK